MPKIHTIATDTTITGTDKLLGSDGAVGAANATKNYTMTGISDYVLSQTDTNTFKTIEVAGQADIVADVNADTLTLVAGDYISIATDASTDTITITGTNTPYTAGTGLDLTGTTLSVDSTVVVTSGAQTIAGAKTFSDTISGSIDGNAATVTNGVYTTGDQTIYGTKTFDATISGDIDGNAVTVTNGVYTTGNQTIAGTKTFSDTIIGSIDGNAGTVTNGVYTSGDQTLYGVKSFGDGMATTEINFITSLGEIQETKVIVTTANLISLNGGGDYTLITSPGSNKMIVPISIVAFLDYNSTTYNFSEDLYIGLEGIVGASQEESFTKIRAQLVNSIANKFEYAPEVFATSHIEVGTDTSLVLHATTGQSVTTGNSDLVLNILYRVVDFT
jgi:hypothetical protein